MKPTDLWLRRIARATEGFIAAGLVYFLLNYGLGKVTDRQFFVRLPWLDEPTGNLDGFQLAWTFHAYSRRAEVVFGVVETLCAVLLLFPRTRLIGAILTTAVMAHIVLLNVEYGIGAVIPSAPMLAAAAMILAFNWRGIWSMLAGRVAPARPLVWPKWPGRVGRAALFVVFAWGCYQAWEYHRMVQPFMRPPEVYGRYRIGLKPDAKWPTPLTPGAIVYLDLNGSAGLRAGAELYMGRYKVDESTGELEATFYRAGFDYFHEQHRTGEASTRLFVPENVVLAIKGRYRLGPTGHLTWDANEPSGLSLELTRDGPDWPARHRGSAP
jgi:hypothetical protein